MTLANVRAAMAARDWSSALEGLEEFLVPGTAELADAKRLASICYTEQEKLDIAQELAQESIFFKPTNAAAWYQLGIIHQLLAGDGPDHYIEAHMCFERAYTMAPESPVTATGLGASAFTMGQRDMAVSLYQSAQKQPYPIAANAEGGVHLMLGNYQKGWEKFEARTVLADGTRWPSYAGTLEELADKTVVVRAEQGFGDIIQFMRYVPRLKSFCRNVVFEVHSGLETLCATFTATKTVTSTYMAAPDDVSINIMSLPLLLGPAIGWKPLPPLSVPGQFLGKRAGTGLCHASMASFIAPNSVYMNAVNRRKNAPAPLVQLMADTHGPFRSLVHQDLGTADWFETAMVIAGMERVITVDTGVAHLAASLGVETWVLQRFDHCWRWDDGWYKTARIFKQDSPGDWGSVFRKVTEALQQKG